MEPLEFRILRAGEEKAALEFSYSNLVKNKGQLCSVGAGWNEVPLYDAALVPNHRGAELCKALLDAGATVGLGQSPLEEKDEMNPEVVKLITEAAAQQFSQRLAKGRAT